jgi:hypothetical protein
MRADKFAVHNAKLKGNNSNQSMFVWQSGAAKLLAMTRLRGIVKMTQRPVARPTTLRVSNLL